MNYRRLVPWAFVVLSCYYVDPVNASDGSPDGSQEKAFPTTISTIPLRVKIPDSTDVVNTEVALDTTVPDCVREDPSSVEENGGITVTADVFTECARKELRRIRDKLDDRPAKPATSQGGADKAASIPSTPSSTSTEDQDADKHGGHDGSKRQDKPSESTPPSVDDGLNDGDGAAGPSGDAAALANAAAQAFPEPNPDMATVVHTVIDYDHVMNDLRRILRGEFFAVLREYPGRMRQLFWMVNELPGRLRQSIAIVNRLQKKTTQKTSTAVLTNLKEYLTRASQTARDLPTALTLVNVMDTLRNLAYKIGNRVSRNPDEGGSAPPAQQVALLSKLEDLLQNPLGRVLDLAPYRQVAHGVEQGTQLLGRRIYDFHPARLIPPGLYPRNLFGRRRYQTASEGQSDEAQG